MIACMPPNVSFGTRLKMDNSNNLNCVHNHIWSPWNDLLGRDTKPRNVVPDLPENSLFSTIPSVPLKSESPAVSCDSHETCRKFSLNDTNVSSLLLKPYTTSQDVKKHKSDLSESFAAFHGLDWNVWTESQGLKIPFCTDANSNKEKTLETKLEDDNGGIDIDLDVTQNCASGLLFDHYLKLEVKDMPVFGVCPEALPVIAYSCCICNSAVKAVGLKNHFEKKHGVNVVDSVPSLERCSEDWNKKVCSHVASKHLKLHVKRSVSTTTSFTVLKRPCYENPISSTTVILSMPVSQHIHTLSKGVQAGEKNSVSISGTTNENSVAISPFSMASVENPKHIDNVTTPSSCTSFETCSDRSSSACSGNFPLTPVKETSLGSCTSISSHDAFVTENSPELSQSSNHASFQKHSTTQNSPELSKFLSKFRPLTAVTETSPSPSINSLLYPPQTSSEQSESTFQLLTPVSITASELSTSPSIHIITQIKNPPTVLPSATSDFHLVTAVPHSLESAHIMAPSFKLLAPLNQTPDASTISGSAFQIFTTVNPCPILTSSPNSSFQLITPFSQNQPISSQNFQLITPLTLNINNSSTPTDYQIISPVSQNTIGSPNISTSFHILSSFSPRIKRSSAAMSDIQTSSQEVENESVFPSIVSTFQPLPSVVENVLHTSVAPIDLQLFTAFTQDTDTSSLNPLASAVETMTIPSSHLTTFSTPVIENMSEEPSDISTFYPVTLVVDDVCKSPLTTTFTPLTTMLSESSESPVTSSTFHCPTPVETKMEQSSISSSVNSCKISSATENNTKFDCCTRGRPTKILVRLKSEIPDEECNNRENDIPSSAKSLSGHDVPSSVSSTECFVDKSSSVSQHICKQGCYSSEQSYIARKPYFHFNKHCGVRDQKTNKRCMKPVVLCNLHSLEERKAVKGRTKSVEDMIKDYKWLKKKPSPFKIAMSLLEQNTVDNTASSSVNLSNEKNISCAKTSASTSASLSSTTSSEECKNSNNPCPSTSTSFSMNQCDSSNEDKVKSYISGNNNRMSEQTSSSTQESKKIPTRNIPSIQSLFTPLARVPDDLEPISSSRFPPRPIAGPLPYRSPRRWQIREIRRGFQEVVQQVRALRQRNHRVNNIFPHRINNITRNNSHYRHTRPARIPRRTRCIPIENNTGYHRITYLPHLRVINETTATLNAMLERRSQFAGAFALLRETESMRDNSTGSDYIIPELAPYVNQNNVSETRRETTFSSFDTSDTFPMSEGSTSEVESDPPLTSSDMDVEFSSSAETHLIEPSVSSPPKFLSEKDSANDGGHRELLHTFPNNDETSGQNNLKDNSQIKYDSSNLEMSISESSESSESTSDSDDESSESSDNPVPLSSSESEDNSSSDSSLASQSEDMCSEIREVQNSETLHVISNSCVEKPIFENAKDVNFWEESEHSGNTLTEFPVNQPTLQLYGGYDTRDIETELVETSPAEIGGCETSSVPLVVRNASSDKLTSLTIKHHFHQSTKNLLSES